MAKDWKDSTQRKVKESLLKGKFKLVEGKNIFRILPTYEAYQEENYSKYRPYFEYLSHKNVGPKNHIVRCGKDIDSREGECWLCDEIIERYLKSGKSAKKAIAKKLQPQEQTFMFVAKWDRSLEVLQGPLAFYVPGGNGATS